MDIMRLLRIAKKEGKVVLAGPDGDLYTLSPYIEDRSEGYREYFANLSTSEYMDALHPRPSHVNVEEKVVSLTKEDLIDKINRDIALWKEGQADLPEQEDEEGENDPITYIEPLENAL